MPFEVHKAQHPGPLVRVHSSSAQSLSGRQTAVLRQRELRFGHPDPGTREKARGGLTEGCHISSAGSGLPSHTCGCTCSRRPRGSSLRPRALGWVSCSHTPPRGTTETQQGGKAAHSTGNWSPPREKTPCPPKPPVFIIYTKADYFGVCTFANFGNIPSLSNLTALRL